MESSCLQETVFARCNTARMKGRYKCSPAFRGIKMIIKKVRLINKIAHFSKSPTEFSSQWHQREIKNRGGCQNFDGKRKWGKRWADNKRQEPACVNKQYMVGTLMLHWHYHLHNSGANLGRNIFSSGGLDISI